MTAVESNAVIPGWNDDGQPLPERLDHDTLVRAYRFSERAHLGQKRLSGENYVSHCVEVARILADLQLDTVTVASGLIHDVVEDTDVSVADVEAEFGKEISEIVDGLTKIGHLPLNSSQERQVENYRKLLLSIAKDARVILIKLADRLHNMRTLEHLAADKRARIALETRDLYAPLAHRFGMARVRWELEDLSFKHIESDEYKKLAKLVALTREARIIRSGNSDLAVLIPLAPRRPLKSKERSGFARAAAAWKDVDVEALKRRVREGRDSGWPSPRI